MMALRRSAVLFALLAAACEQPPTSTSPSAGAPVAAAFLGKPDRVLPVIDRQQRGAAQIERFSGQFDGGRITLTLMSGPGGRVQVVAASPRQGPCTVNWREDAVWSGNVLRLANGIVFTRQGRQIGMTEAETLHPSCSFHGMLNPT